MAVRALKTRNRTPTPPSQGEFEGHEASSVVISCIAVIEGDRDQLAWGSMMHAMGSMAVIMGLGVHERTLVNSHHGEFWGVDGTLVASLAVIMGVLRTDAAALGSHCHPFGLGFAVVAMVRMPIFPDPHPSRPLHCGVSPYALPQNFGREFPAYLVAAGV